MLSHKYYYVPNNNNNFRPSRGLDGLQILKLSTYEEDKSDIGTREIADKRARYPMVNVLGTSNGLVDSGMC